MNKLFKWVYRPSGNCPVQAEGWFLGYYFYFRARGSYATIDFYNNKGEFYLDQSFKNIILKEAEKYKAGWLSKEECKSLIYKGCLKFIFSILFVN